MKALSGYAEWFWLMAKNWKNIENRSKPLPMSISTNLPARIYLHASKNDCVQRDNATLEFIKKNLTTDQWNEFCFVEWGKLRGHIIGEITIIRQIKKHNYIESDHVDLGSQQTEFELLKNSQDPYVSPWFFGKFGYIVHNGKLYKKPIPCKGKLGFFEPDCSPIQNEGED